jgi:hypothetical protein
VWASAPTPGSPRCDRTADLASIQVPALFIGTRYDTMDPAHMKMMAERLPTGATYTAQTAAIWPCTTTRPFTSPASSTSCDPLAAGRMVRAGNGQVSARSC